MSLDNKIVIYLACEILVAIVSVLGNALVVTVFLRDKRLRTPTNLYVFSLAVTDLLTSTVAMPVYVHSMLTQRPRDFHACLYINTLILTFCTVSIFHLIAVSFDRYMAVVWRRKPASHKRGMRHATVLISLAWISGGLMGCLPVMGWHNGVPPDDEPLKCVFTNVIKMNYLLFLFYATIVTPTLIMVFFYGSIYHTVQKHNDRMQSAHYSLDTRMSRKKRIQNLDQDHSQSAVTPRPQTMQERQTAKTRRIIFSLVLVVACFLVSWYPLYIMNAITYYCGSACHLEPSWFYAPIILSHLASAINPFIYARTMPGYKQAFVEALACKQIFDECEVDDRNLKADKKKKTQRVTWKNCDQHGAEL